ncbi:MAG: 2-oxoacid:acceptor oxidoreductase subunit alpha [Deferribacteraceae bacterium]|jgi:2-oxoglutarate ferredoxin oxidoreductase subunit alpha|nr:2-oxoacid:acceptor oxidoreductase subunit alpha [Deferribacteraceae bacterium]
MSKREFMQGNDAIAYGALYAGCRFFAGYPITPSTEIAEKMAAELPKHGGRFIQMEDEIAAMAAIVGASITGVKSFTATSGPGMSLKLENLGYACMTETPCVIVNVQRGGPSTGLPTGPSQSDIMQARWGAHGDHPCIAVTPSTVREQFDETVRAFNLSEKYRIPVIIISDEIIGHMREAVNIPEKGELPVFDRVKPTAAAENYKPYNSSSGDIPPMANFGEGYRFHITGLTHEETGFPTNSGAVADREGKRMQRKIDANYDDIVKVEEYRCDDADVILFAIGSVARSAKDAVDTARESGFRLGLMKPLTIWPFPDKHVAKYSGKIKGILVAEMNMGQLTGEVIRASAGKFNVKGLLRTDSEPITPSQIISEAENVL